MVTWRLEDYYSSRAVTVRPVPLQNDIGDLLAHLQPSSVNVCEGMLLFTHSFALARRPAQRTFTRTTCAGLRWSRLPSFLSRFFSAAQ